MVLVLDFDGTVTDAEAEGAPFRRGYLEDLAILVGAPLEEVIAVAEVAEAEVARDPQAHGWVYGGAIVAPATVDPYLRIMPVARRVLDRWNCIPDEATRSRLLDGILYKYNYTKTAIAFRPGAREALEALDLDRTWVVTNSHTEPVQRKIRLLADGGPLLALAERVVGRARKYVVDPTFDAVPEALTLPGLSRPVLLRRRAYHEVLARLLAEAGADWPELAVVGDIFELDLALPLAMGARVALVAGPHTPAYERAFLEAHPRGAVLEAIAEVPGWVRGGSSGEMR